MVAVLANPNGGPRHVSMTRDEDGHRNYTAVWRVQVPTFLDAAATAIQCPYLPVPGDPYIVGNDVDLYAWWRYTAKVTPIKSSDGNPTLFYDVECNASTKPDPKGESRCTDTEPQDPLTEPMKVSGSFVKYTREADINRWGVPIQTSSWEQIRGPQVEFDANRQTVRVEQNVADLEMYLLSRMVDTVNYYPMWGMPPRTIKLSSISWSKQYHGACYVYYNRAFDFDVDPKGFDRDIIDQGTKALNGHWNVTTGGWDLIPINGSPPNPYNPAHFTRYKDRRGDYTQVILDGLGKPYDPTAAPRVFRDFGRLPTPVPTGLPSGSGSGPTSVTTELQDRGSLQTSSSYTYAVSAVVAGVETNATATISALSVPTTTQRSVLVTWPAVTSATEYRVYRKRMNTGGTTTLDDWGLVAVSVGVSGNVHVEVYPDSDFSLLALPVTV